MHFSPPTISVLVIAYNHEPYIETALNSILAQKVDAALEILVADDCSTDKTVEVVKRIRERSPFPITLLTSEKNIGHTRNYERAWKLAQGDFIAHCDGDDFWIDPLKLQKQLTFLKDNPTFSFCSHKIKVQIGNEYLEDLIPRTSKEVFNTLDLIDACPSHNSSLFFRRNLFKELPPFFFEITGHDWCISILNSLHGPFKIFPEPMAVWRMRTDGLWGGESNLFHLKHTDKFLGHLRGFLPRIFNRAIELSITRNNFKMAEELMRLDRLEEGKVFFKKLLLSRHILALGPRHTLSLGFRLYSPRVYRNLINLRNNLYRA